MVIVIREGAKRQLREIFDYYRIVTNRKVAYKMIDKIRDTIELLATHPLMGTTLTEYAGLSFAYRSIVAHPHYKVIYRVENDKVIVISVWDCRQDPATLEDELNADW